MNKIKVVVHLSDDYDIPNHATFFIDVDNNHKDVKEYLYNQVSKKYPSYISFDFEIMDN